MFCMVVLGFIGAHEIVSVTSFCIRLFHSLSFTGFNRRFRSVLNCPLDQRLMLAINLSTEIYSQTSVTRRFNPVYQIMQSGWRVFSRLTIR